MYQVILSDLFPMSENSRTQLSYNVTDFLLYGSRENNHCDAFVLNVQEDISFSSGWKRPESTVAPAAKADAIR